jgi:hypothetical protein
MEACAEADVSYVDGKVSPWAKDSEGFLQNVSGGGLRQLMKYQAQRNNIGAAVRQLGVLRSPMLEGQGFNPPLLLLCNANTISTFPTLAANQAHRTLIDITLLLTDHQLVLIVLLHPEKA